MKLLFEHGDHQIVVSRGIASADLVVDSYVCDTISGYINTQLKSFELKGKAKNPDGSEDDVLVKLAFGFPYDTITCYYNGELIGTQKSAL